MDINVIGTGSSGNAILLDGSVLIDAGIPYKHLKRHIRGLKVVLLTHIHGDHFSAATIRGIHVNCPDIKFCCGGYMIGNLTDIGLPARNIITVHAGKKYKTQDIIFSPINLFHDVPNIGYRILINGEKHIHATDTVTMDGVLAPNYDSATIEANHHLPTAEKIIADKHSNGEFCHLVKATKTHLSVEKCCDFIIKNNIKSFTPVHIGGSTYDQVIEYIDKHVGNKNTRPDNNN